MPKVTIFAGIGKSGLKVQRADAQVSVVVIVESVQAVIPLVDMDILYPRAGADKLQRGAFPVEDCNVGVSGILLRVAQHGFLHVYQAVGFPVENGVDPALACIDVAEAEDVVLVVAVRAGGVEGVGALDEAVDVLELQPVRGRTE